MKDYTVGDTIHIAFSTRSANGTPTALAGSPVVSAYENADLTQITAGITLGVSHDSVVGLNMLTIVATGANGFESGKDYHLVITTGTVDAQSVVGEVVGSFSLGRSAAAVDLANATDGLGAIKSETALIVADTNELQTDDVPGLIAALDAVVDTVKAETVLILADTAEIGAAGAGLTAITGKTDNLPVDPADQSLIIAATDAIMTRLGVPVAASVSADLAVIDAIADAILVDTADIQPKLGTPAVDVSADIAAMKVDTAAILVDTGTTLDARLPAALTGAGNMKADMLAVDGVVDAADRLQRVAQGNVFCTVGAASTTTSIVTSAMDPAAAVTDQFKGRIVTFKNDTTTANLRGQSTDITGNTALGVLTVTALTTAPASGDTFTIS